MTSPFQPTPRLLTIIASAPEPGTLSVKRPRRRHRASNILLALLAASPGVLAQTSIPPFVEKLIAHYRSAPLRGSPDSVWRYIYKGEPVYYVAPLWCCDIPSVLYDATGRLICRPDGGFTGIGDGKCLDFLKERSHGEVLWSHGTAAKSP